MFNGSTFEIVRTIDGAGNDKRQHLLDPFAKFVVDESNVTLLDEDENLAVANPFDEFITFRSSISTVADPELMFKEYE